jgi:hypothetical protein
VLQVSILKDFTFAMRAHDFFNVGSISFLHMSFKFPWLSITMTLLQLQLAFE